MQMAGLLTYSRLFCLPSPYLLKIRKSGFDLNTVLELTAAGQLRNYTVFPFNSFFFREKKPKALQMYLINKHYNKHHYIYGYNSWYETIIPAPFYFYPHKC